MAIDQLLAFVAAGTALVAAARSTWSPCGLSMLSSITPFGEKSRGNRYPVTAAWFVVGSAAGGATLGSLVAVGAVIASALGLPDHPAAVASVACVLAALGAAVDAGVLGPVLPVVRRQVDDRWLSRYRSWAYAVGFGWQIGAGLLTYVMTSAVALLVALGVLTGSPTIGFVAVTCFGTMRGLAVLLTTRARDPRNLRALHLKMDRAEEPVRWAAVSVQAAAAAVFVAYLSPVALLIAVPVVSLLGFARLRLRHEPPGAGAVQR